MSDLSLDDIPVVGDALADLVDDQQPKKKRHWFRRLLLLGLLAGIAAAVAKSREPKRPPLSVVPPPAERRTPSAAQPTATPPAQAAPAAPEAPAAAAAAPRSFSSAGSVVAGNHAGSAQPLPDGSAPGPEYVIKGNEDSMIYHTPDSPSYERTVAEVWFATEDDAVAAGFRAPKRRGR